MTYEYDFEMIKRAYAEMARRAREKDKPRHAVEDDTMGSTRDLRDAIETRIDAEGAR